MTAIRCDRFFHPDAVLLDVELKGIDGFETLRKLKKLDPGARVLIVTNYDSPLLRRRAEEEGARAFVCKDRLLDLETVIKSFGQ
ncbi:MAG: response regulator [Bacteroidota bacterium]